MNGIGSAPSRSGNQWLCQRFSCHRNQVGDYEMSRNLLLAIALVIVAVGGFLIYQEQKDDVRIDLPGNNDITIDR